MSNAFEYIIKIKDHASGVVGKLGEHVQKVYAKIEADEKRLMKTNELYGKSFDNIGNAIGKLKAKSHGLQIVSSADIANVRALNSEIKRLESLQNKIGSMNGSKLKHGLSRSKKS